MTIPSQSIVVSYRDARKATAPSDVPTEHYKSLPLPTLRWSAAGYASFASPCTRMPGHPLELSAPDRWWVRGAHTRGLVAYNLTVAVQFSADLDPTRLILSMSERTLAARIEDFTVFDELMDRVAPAFFAGETTDSILRQDAMQSLTALLPVGLTPWHRALAADFFEWLAA